MKIRLIDDVRGSWKLLSTWLAAFWSALGAWCAVDPSTLVAVWNLIPDDLKADLPLWLRRLIIFAIAFGSWWVSRVVRQPVRKGAGS